MSQRVVVMDHPTLPGQPITVPESSVPDHMAAGWVPREDLADLAPRLAGGPVVIEPPVPPSVVEAPSPKPSVTTKKGS